MRRFEVDFMMKKKCLNKVDKEFKMIIGIFIVIEEIEVEVGKEIEMIIVKTNPDIIISNRIDMIMDFQIGK